jgi:hypothetical protein
MRSTELGSGVMKQVRPDIGHLPSARIRYTPSHSLTVRVLPIQPLATNSIASIIHCNKEANDSLASLYPGARLDAAIVAFVPVPLFWGFAYLILFLWRWVKRGFKERSEFTMFE